MHKKITNLVFLVYLIWPISAKARFYDVFNPVQVRLERLIWSDSLSEEARIWMQSVLDTLSYTEIESAIVARGVYLEKLDLNFKSGYSGFEDLMNDKLQLAKLSPDPTSCFLSSLPYAEMANRPQLDHPYSSPNDYVLKILLVRIVKQIRSGHSITHEHMDDFICMLDDQKKLFLQLAVKSPLELMGDFETIAFHPDSSEYYVPDFSAILSTYRKNFIDYFKKYYSPDLYNTLSGDAQDVVLNYWIQNNDLIEQGDLSKLMHLIDTNLAKKYHKQSITFTLLKCLIENCTREDYINQVEKFSDKELQRLYDEKIRRIMSIENRFRMNPLQYEWTSIPEAPMPFTIRPELVVTRFIASHPKDIVQYLKDNLHPEFYANPDFLTNPKTLEIRAATQRLGRYEGKMINPIQSKIDTITSILLDICIMDSRRCYEEGSWLILGLGKWALPGLKKAFISPDKKRIEMASQLLLQMKDEEVVRWLMEIITTSKDKDVLNWSPAYLYMMEKFTPNPMPNRGITKEESDRIAREIIEPFFKTLYPPVQKQE